MSSAAQKLDWNTNEILEEFANFPLFETFPKNLLAELATASEIIVLPKQSEILTQGQRNDQIFFLSQGTAGVYVDGARVNFGDGWGLVRASNTQPVLVLRFESVSPERRDAIRAEVERVVADAKAAAPA